MHPLMHVISAQCYFSTAFHPDAKCVIWMRSRNSELAYPSFRATAFGREVNSCEGPVLETKDPMFLCETKIHRA